MKIECGVLEDPWREPPAAIYTLTKAPEECPAEPAYVEIAFDRGKVTVWSRNEKEWTGKFANVEESVKALPLTTAIAGR